MKVKLISISPNAEQTIAYCARVSSSKQDNPNIAGLLKYCSKHGHWSVFEMANMVVEITTSRAISPQILRHRSFNFQEFSQRYSEAQAFEYYDPRRQDHKNKQNSFDDMSNEDHDWFHDAQAEVIKISNKLYQEALDKGIAKESARFLLPLNTSTKLYMNGTIRSWIHYLNVRCGPETQLEHREIANEIKKLFIEQLPIIAEAMEWRKNEIKS
jgi:thymidylate synthase (FAD)